MLRRITIAAAFVITGGIAPRAASQATPAPAPVAPEVGTMAPDFTLHGNTRFGPLGNAVKLSDFRGQTVVVAFFPKARTKG
ncbi:MAG: hypothetical protein JWO05_2547 [Gemmatimonadetes bacterium]|nr:hypothetical protein [Gemmatimonadota bacterium]